MFTAPAPSAPTLSTSTLPASPTSPSRTGRPRGLSYLRSLTHNHLHSLSSSPSPAQGSRPSISRTRSQPSPAAGNADSGHSRSSSQDATRQAGAEASSPNTTSGWLPAGSGRSGLSRVTTSNRRRISTDPLSAGPTTLQPHPPATPVMTRNRAQTATSALSVRNDANTASSALDGLDENSDGAMSKTQMPSIRFTPFVDQRSTRPSLVFPPISRTLPSSSSIIRVGRYSERDTAPEISPNKPSAAPVGFKSKVVSRRHCEFWCEDGQWWIKDVKSSSGTFLNHIRLSQPGVESKPYPVNDGDVVQLGIDFRGGEEMIFRCVKIRIECNRGWQKGLNKFNKSTHQRLRDLTKGAHKKDSESASTHNSECAICLMSIAPCQSLFVAPCSHVWHYKCIRPILNGTTYPNFLCPNCRAVTNLEEDVDEPEMDWEDAEEEAAPAEDAGPEGRVDNDGHHQAVKNGPHEDDAHESDEALLAGMNGVSLQEAFVEDGPSSSAISQPVPISGSRTTRLNDATEAASPPLTPGASEQCVLSSEVIEREGPMTPRNDAGPFILDGSAGRTQGRRLLNLDSLGTSSDPADASA